MMTGDIERIREALQFIPASDRNTWVKMGMAVKSELGDAGFDVWEAWSLQADSFNATDARDVWKSIRGNGKVTAGTLFHEAKAHGWRDDGTYQKPTPEELAERRRTAAERAAKEEAEIARERAEAASKAAAIWDASTPAWDDHPYLSRKQVSPVATLREIDAGAAAEILGYAPKSRDEPLAGRLLVVPVKVAGELSTLELIDEGGRKSALYGGAKAGGYWAAQPLPDGDGDGAGLTLLIGEGVATVLTGKEATRHRSIAALSAGNLAAVAKAMRERYPAAALVILADLVKATGAPDPHAIEAARAVGGLLAVPDFGNDRPDGAKDFNDMAVLCGLEVVRVCIKVAAESASATRRVDGDDWPEPKPIQAALHPVPAFDADTLLPEALRGSIVDEADRMPCPPDFIAAAALVELGAIIGARCALKPKSRDDWLIVPNLWGGIGGLPSAKKSPAIDVALKPMGRLLARAMEAHQAEMEAFESDKTVFEAKKEAIEGRIKSAAKAKDSKSENLDAIAKELQTHRQQARDALILRRYKTNDTTVEKLGELLRENPNGLLVLRDELVGLIASWDKEGREGDRAFFLEAWNGNQNFDTDRIKRGSIFIPNLCVSIFGGIQPDKLTAYLEQATHALANDGMLQRFQVLVNPDRREWRDRSPNRQARDRAFAVFEALADFDPVTWGAAPADDFNKFPHFRLDEAALEVFIEWSTELHRSKLPAEENPIIAQHLAKFDKLFPALALILHLVECAATGQRGPVTAEAALRAAAWCEYLEAHARRCYGLLADDGLRAAQALADKVRLGKLPDGFTARDVRRNQWRSLRTDEAVQAALDWLEDEGWLQAKEAGTGTRGGRPTLAYRINPKVKKANKPGGNHGELA